MLIQVQPILPSKYVQGAVEFYVEKLGFRLTHLHTEKPAYAVLQRDQIELHLQWQDPKQWDISNCPVLRILVSDIETLYQELLQKTIFNEGTVLAQTPWATLEFSFYDCDGNGLIFYQPL
jgi:catechol 2,3-dioxygenase-like lactoylglutathione lyase family enzyme